MSRRFRSRHWRTRSFVRRGAALALVLALLWITRLFSPAPPPATPEDLPAGVHALASVIDGDTLLLENGARIRLIGIDTPETVHPDLPVEAFGPEATAFTARFLESGSPRLEFDRERKDRYDRFLAYVYVGDRQLNETLLRVGLARATLGYSFSSEMKARFRTAEREARRAAIGIWSSGPAGVGQAF